MQTPFTPRTADTSLAAILNRAVTAAFSLAVVGTIGVMTFAQYVNGLAI